jgi:hypothetical protein
MNLNKMIFSVALTAALCSAPLVAQQVKTDYDHKVDFTRYHTFSWKSVDAADPFYDQRIQDDVNRDLTARGWRLVPQGGDIVLTASRGVHDQREYDTFYNGLGGFGGRRGGGFGGSGVSSTTSNDIPVGTVEVEMYDPVSRNMIWRGAANGSLSNNEEKNTKKLAKEVDKMFDKFPAKSSGM